MKKLWVVYCSLVDKYYFDNEEDAIKEYEELKEYLMAEGHEPDTTVYLFETKKMAVSVIDEEKMKKSHPKEEGLDFDYWAKWEESCY